MTARTAIYRASPFAASAQQISYDAGETLAAIASRLGIPEGARATIYGAHNVGKTTAPAHVPAHLWGRVKPKGQVGFLAVPEDSKILAAVAVIALTAAAGPLGTAVSGALVASVGATAAGVAGSLAGAAFTAEGARAYRAIMDGAPCA